MYAKIPLWQDNRFTTNYFLPNSATGNVDSGSYIGPDGSTANFLSGNYTKADGSSGNLYPGSAPPNTATLDLPTAFSTASGIGSGIAATALGGLATYTTTIPGTTIPATTLSPTILPAKTVAPCNNDPCNYRSTNHHNFHDGYAEGRD